MKVLFFLALQFATTFAYNEQDNTTYIYNKIIRERKLLPQNLFTEMSCQEYTTIQNCTCEAYCFKQVPNTLTCRANECTQWNKAVLDMVTLKDGIFLLEYGLHLDLYV
jgi:hypothetical protein